jgi:FkbM family methyltransferase
VKHADSSYVIIQKALTGAVALFYTLGGSRRSYRVSEPQWRAVENGPLRGLELYLPTGNGRSWADRITSGTYEPRFVAALADYARPDAVLYDVGAHVGFYTCGWLSMGGGRVEAFEPLPASSQIVSEALSRNGLKPRGAVHNVALSDYNGAGKLIADQSELGVASMAFLDRKRDRSGGNGDGRHSAPVEVVVWRLQDFVAKAGLPPPTLIKLDVEGAEDSVLAGAADLIAEAKPAILAEIHNINSGMRVAGMLARFGYELQILGEQSGMSACLWKR